MILNEYFIVDTSSILCYSKNMFDDKNYEEIDGDVKPLYKGINGPKTSEGVPLDEAENASREAVRERGLFSEGAPLDVFDGHVPDDFMTDLAHSDQSKVAGRIATAEIVDKTKLDEMYKEMWENERSSDDNRALYSPQHSTKKSVPAIDERLLTDQPLGPTSVSSRRPRPGRRTQAQRNARAFEAAQKRRHGRID